MADRTNNSSRLLGWLFIGLGLVGSIGSLWADQIWLFYDTIYSSGASMQWVEALIPYYPFVPFFPGFAIIMGAYLIVKSRR